MERCCCNLETSTASSCNLCPLQAETLTRLLHDFYTIDQKYYGFVYPFNHRQVGAFLPCSMPGPAAAGMQQMHMRLGLGVLRTKTLASYCCG